MSFVINTAAIFPKLLPGTYASQMCYNTFNTEEAVLYKKGTSNQAFEFFTHDKPTGPAPEKFEGQPTETDDMRTMWQFSAAHKQFGTSFTITYEAMRFNLYKRQFPQQLKTLTNSHVQTRNYRAIEPFVNGFNANAITYDGKPLFAIDHPTAVGTYANTIGVPTQFEESVLEDIDIMLAGMTDDAGNLIALEPDSLIVGPVNKFNASRNLNNPDRPGTTNRDISALHYLNTYPGGIHVNHWFGPTWEDWYVKTRGGSPGLEDGGGALHLIADEFRIDMHADERNKTIDAISYESYLYVIWNNRQYVGIQGLS
jgi:hypothetical protein